MNKKFELLLDDTITIFGVKLFRIKALISFRDVEKGELGGYVEKEDNLGFSGNAWVYGDARVYGNAEVSGNAWVYGDADYIVFKNHWSSGRYFTYTKSNKMWRVGCFYGTGQELIKKAYQGSEISGKHYEAYVEFVEKLEKMEKQND